MTLPIILSFIKNLFFVLIVDLYRTIRKYLIHIAVMNITNEIPQVSLRLDLLTDVKLQILILKKSRIAFFVETLKVRNKVWVVITQMLTSLI